MNIGIVLELLSGAIATFSAFKGTAAAAKTVESVQTAVGTITALVPLVQQFGDGQEVTPEDVREALAGMDTALAALDKLIEEKS